MGSGGGGRGGGGHFLSGYDLLANQKLWKREFLKIK